MDSQIPESSWALEDAEARRGYCVLSRESSSFASHEFATRLRRSLHSGRTRLSSSIELADSTRRDPHLGNGLSDIRNRCCFGTAAKSPPNCTQYDPGQSFRAIRHSQSGSEPSPKPANKQSRDLSKVAEAFCGGGHEAASGISDSGSSAAFLPKALRGARASSRSAEIIEISPLIRLGRLLE